MRKKVNVPFTPQEKAVLAANPFTLSVNDYQIRFTLEFKEYLLAERERHGTPWKEIFRKAGYDPELLGKGRVEGIVLCARRQAASPEGLHETSRRKAQTDKEQEKKRMQTSIRELRQEVEYLRQQVEFLKKIQQLQNLDENDALPPTP